MGFLTLVVVLLATTALAEKRWTDECGWSMFDDAGAEPAIVDIVGGWESRVHEFPYQGSLSLGGSKWCGCVLINSQWALTAAHCTSGLGPNAFTVRLGEHLLSQPNENVVHYDVAEIIQHEDYNSNRIENDISLLRLVGEVALNDGTFPACRPRDNFDYEGSTSSVSGWGTTSSGGSSTDELRVTNVPVMSYAACDVSQNGILPGMLCAGFDGSNDRDACQGDSGGPLAVKNDNNLFEIVGLVSWGYGCAGSTPGVYTDVPYYLDWVDANLPQ